MPGLHVTKHAIERYQQRVANVPAHDAATALRSKAIQAADRFGAPYVRLAGGQHVVLRRHAVITVLPRDTSLHFLATHRQED